MHIPRFSVVPFTPFFAITGAICLRYNYRAAVFLMAFRCAFVFVHAPGLNFAPQVRILGSVQVGIWAG